MASAEGCPLYSQASLEPVTARHPDGRIMNVAEPFNATPERDDECKRHRVDSEASQEEQMGAAPAPAGSEGASQPGASGGACRADSAASASTDVARCIQDPPPVSQGVESILRSYLVSWGQRLVQLQPKVYMTEHLIVSGLYLFKYLRQLQVQACCEGKFPLQYLSNEQLLIHDLVACWWVALKHCSVRTAVPNRTLMCRATNASAELLSDRELAMLVAVDWEVQAILKQGGLVQ